MRGFPGVGSSVKPVVNGAIDLLAGNGDDVSCCFVVVISLIALLKLWGGWDLFLVNIIVYSCVEYGEGKLTNLFALKDATPPPEQSTDR